MNKLQFFLRSLLFSPTYAQSDILVGYASQTGSAKKLASQSSELLAANGHDVTCLSLAQVDVKQLDNYSKIVLFVSTCGEGDIPDNGVNFYHRITEREEHLRTPVYIFALGDRSYSQFCEAGLLFFKQFERLGAMQEQQLQLNDGSPYKRWTQWFAGISGIENIDIKPAEPEHIHLSLVKRESLHSASCGVGRGAFRLQLLLAENNIEFKSGDLIGITPPNEVRERLYSVSAVLEGGIELCIGRVSYEKNSERKVGACSNYLIENLAIGEMITVSHRQQGGLVLPRPEQPLMMVATGTGIAPMMCLLRERQAGGGSASNWLLFGNRHPDQDYYYQDDLALLQKEGVLTRLDLAFSRLETQQEYVQDVLADQQGTVVDWLLDHKALLYVCGQTALREAVSRTLLQAFTTRFGDSLQAESYYQTLIDQEQLVFELY